jgi:hypothetical protein
VRAVEEQGERRLNTRREVNIFNLGDKVKECQQNYLEHILRMPTNRIHRKLFTHRLKGRRRIGRLPKRLKDHFVYLDERKRSEGPKLAVVGKNDELK